YKDPVVAGVEGEPGHSDEEGAAAQLPSKEVAVGARLRQGDLLFDGRTFYRFSTPRLETIHTHGTGCSLSAAITAGLALGKQLPEAVSAAKRFLQRALETAPGLGRGSGPINH
ncbi:MAG: bifunctional hydroxymethylpyrimidine kinase/phosphomethylpyrimidine kinase, partial [Deinococcus sp.]|nr:bifunctional hydroxymethylpyrimidine kinase/phosphomethylpyrimidine kinase [Deinococcus sp.]